MKSLFKKKSTREILAFSLLPFGISTIYSIVGTALNMYFTDVLGLSLSMTGIMLAVTKVWDAVNDPLMGMLVDKTNTRWGKCRPYVFWMSGPMILVTALLFAPVDFGQTGNFIYAIIAYILYYTIYTALDIPNKGLAPLVFPEDKLRVKALSWNVHQNATSFLRLFLQRSVRYQCSFLHSDLRKRSKFRLKKKSISMALKLFLRIKSILF